MDLVVDAEDGGVDWGAGFEVVGRLRCASLVG